MAWFCNEYAIFLIVTHLIHHQYETQQVILGVIYFSPIFHFYTHIKWVKLSKSFFTVYFLSNQILCPGFVHMVLYHSVISFHIFLAVNCYRGIWQLKLSYQTQRDNLYLYYLRVGQWDFRPAFTTGLHEETSRRNFETCTAHQRRIKTWQ